MESIYRRIVVAVDRDDEVGLYTLKQLAERFCERGSHLKLGLPFVLEYGVRGVREMFSVCGDHGSMVILDLKMADIGAIMRMIASKFRGAASAVIAHAFVGYNSGLRDLKEALDEWGVKLVLVASMSHPGSREVLDHCMERIFEVIDRTRPWGVVAPATRPTVVASVKARFPYVRILSPGVGAQGAKPGDAICSGADYEIVGRYITKSPEPVKALDRVVEELKRRCGG